MEYQKIINLLDNAPNKPSKSRTKRSVKVNDDSRITPIVKSNFKL